MEGESNGQQERRLHWKESDNSTNASFLPQKESTFVSHTCSFFSNTHFLNLLCPEL
jgi:hypothetical protein